MLCSVVAFAPNTVSDMMPLYRDLGDHRYAITSANPLVQRYFDQGMRLAVALERVESRRSFATAVGQVSAAFHDSVDGAERLVEHTPRLARATHVQTSVYVRTGKYRDAVRAGERALRAIASHRE